MSELDFVGTPRLVEERLDWAGGLITWSAGIAVTSSSRRSVLTAWS
jgi:hypothetical protein